MNKEKVPGMKELEGEAVKHIGLRCVGEIVKVVDAHSVIIVFPSKGIKNEFAYPSAFERNIKFVNKRLQYETDLLIKKLKQGKSISTKGVNQIPEETNHIKEKAPYSFNKHFSEIKRVMFNAYKQLEESEKRGEAPPSPKPDYPNNYTTPWNRGCYVLRYTYAYSFEYLQMFLEILRMIKHERGIRILSLGCGTTIDGWSIQEASNFLGRQSAIEYIGIDYAQWEEDLIPRIDEGNNYKRKYLYEKKAGEYMANCQTLRFDIICFPKSIGDIFRSDKGDYERVLAALQPEKLKEEFVLAFSIPDYEKQERKKEDQEIINELISTVCKRGFKVLDQVENERCEDSVGYSNPNYPSVEQEYVEWSYALTDRKIMTNRKYEKYYIYKLKKEK